MSGENPYLAVVEVDLPQKPYQITVKGDDQEQVVSVDPDDLDENGIGLQGSVLDILEKEGIEIDHACGGLCACSTCHVIVHEGLETCNQATEDEEDMLDMAPGLCSKSRLACQVVPNGTSDIVVEIPEWNRNAVSESPH